MMSVTFEQLLAQAKVELATNGLWLAKKDRTCEATSRLLVAVRALIDTSNQNETKAEAEKARLAKENSKLAGELAEREKDLRRSQLNTVRVGLEAIPEVSQSQRERLLTSNGG